MMKILVMSNTTMKNKLMVLLAVGLLVGPMAVQAAPGGVTDGLRVWLRADTGISVNDGEAVEVWADQSGEGNDAVFNPANVFGENPPVLDASNPGVAGRPTVRFNNVNALELDLGFLVGSDYTIFVVNGRDRTGVANFYIAGDSGGANTNLVLGYETVAQLRQSHFSNDLNAVVPEYVGTELWQMDTFTFDQTVGRSIYQDGVLRASDTSVVPLAANTGTTLGHFRTFGNLYWFQGDLAEVIIYDRALSVAERRAVEAELGVLYGRPYGLVEGLCDGTADSSVTCDTATGLEWLDLTQSTGYSVNAVLGGAGGFLDAGWMVADLAAVELLFLDAGWDGVDDTLNIGNPGRVALVDILLSLLGETGGTSVQSFGEGWALTGITGTVSRPFFSIGDFGSGLGRIACLSAGFAALPSDGTINFANCGMPANAAFGVIGTYLYREGSVSPGTLLEDLGTAVTGVGPGNSLADKIELAQAYLAVPDVQSTCAVLNAFLNQVRAQRDKKLAPEVADQLTEDALVIMNLIGCD